MSVMTTVPTAAPRRPGHHHKPGSVTRRGGVGALFVAPLAVVVAVLFLVPLGVLIFMSFQKWPLLGSPTANGLKNYTSIPDNELFMGAIAFTLLYTLITTVIIFGVSFLLVAISNSRRRGSRFYRTAFFLPYVVGVASASLIWYGMVNDQTGIANRVLESLGLTDGPFGFLDTPDKALATTVSLVVWKFIGFQVIVLLIGLQAVPGELYEAAHLDGASTWQRLRYITVPHLRPTLALLLILSVTGSLLAFDQFMVLTKGGPDNSTVTMVIAVYQTAFSQFSLGKAAALSVLLLIALVALNGVQLLVLRRRDER
jgi:multiple sugar transport system permease protein